MAQPQPIGMAQPQQPGQPPAPQQYAPQRYQPVSHAVVVQPQQYQPQPPREVPVVVLRLSRRTTELLALELPLPVQFEAELPPLSKGNSSAASYSMRARAFM